MVDYITAGRGVLTEAVYPEIIRMVSKELGHKDFITSEPVLATEFRLWVFTLPEMPAYTLIQISFSSDRVQPVPNVASE